jgi:hypothetical protein
MEQVEFFSIEIAGQKMRRMSESGCGFGCRAEQEPKYVHGLEGLAQLLGYSKRTAQNIKASGKIDKAIYQEGRTIIIDRKLAIELLK